MDKKQVERRRAMGSRLRTIRSDMGLTLEDLAAKLKVRRQAVQRWEAGETSPRPHTRAAVLKILGLGSWEDLATQ